MILMGVCPKRSFYNLSHRKLLSYNSISKHYISSIMNQGSKDVAVDAAVAAAKRRLEALRAERINSY